MAVSKNKVFGQSPLAGGLLLALLLGLFLPWAPEALANNPYDPNTQAEAERLLKERGRRAEQNARKVEWEQQQEEANEAMRESQQASMRRAASQRSQQAMISTAQNALMGTLMYTQYTSCKAACNVSCGWKCTPYAGMAALSVATAGMSAAEGRSTDRGVIPSLYNFPNPYDNFNPDVEEFNPPGGPGADGGDPPGPGRGAGGPSPTEILTNLEKDGISIDEKNGMLHTPDGSVPLSTFADVSEGMEALGANEDQIAQVLALSQQVADQFGANVVGMEVNTGGGGGRPAMGRIQLDDSDPLGDYLRSLRGPASQKSAAERVAGKSRMLGGEPIGVAADNIFEMVHRRYQQKRKQGLFIESPDAQPK